MPTGIGQQTELQNCATLQPLGAGPAPAAPAKNPQLAPPPPPTGSNNGGLKVEKRGIPATCSPAAGTCEFEVKITNQTGHLLKKKPLKIFDTMSVGTQTQAKNVLDHQEVPAGLKCTPEGREFNCSQDALSLNPDASMSFKAAFKIDTSEGGPAGFVTNKALVTLGDLTGEATASIAFDKPVNVELPEPEPGGQANPGAGGAANQADAPACATLPVEAGGGGGKTQSGPITIEKTPAVTSCDAATPCSFDIKVSNTSGKEIPGPITIAETPPAGVKTSDPPAPWNCIAAAGPTRSCTHPGPIPANGSLQPPLSFTFPPPAGATKVENCATLGAPLPAGIPAPANPACATIPTTTPDQKGQPKLSIKKSGPAECSDLAGCDFRIEVTNDGDADFKGQLDINEEVTLDGKPAPGMLALSKGSWKCTQAGSPFTCSSLPNVTLGPKGTQTLFFHVVSSELTGAKTMENCANVVGQGTKACVSVPLIQGPKLVLKKEAVDGVCDPECTYRITATNIGNAPFPGPVKIVDFVGATDANGAVFVNPDVVSAKLVNSLAELSCKKPSPRANIDCEINESFRPGQSETIELTTKTDATDFAGDNCVLRLDIPQGGENPMVCAAVLGLRHKGPNLVINKEAPNAPFDGATGHCALTGLCTFQITIKNIGDAPFTGVLHLTDTVGPGTPVRILKGGGFGTCDEARNEQGAGGIAVNNSIKCDIGFPDGIKPNDTVQLEVLVEAGRSWGSDKNLKNCAELTAETDMGPPETRKKDCAEVKLDPFDVGVTKTGDQSCQPGGECRFDIDIFNPNAAVIHNDPVTVTDKLSGLSSAEIVSITPGAEAEDFPCKPQPTQIPFSCTGHMKIMPGHHNHYTMIVRLPADASAASFSNCATVGDGAKDVPRSERDGHQSAEFVPYGLDRQADNDRHKTGADQVHGRHDPDA